MIKGRELLGLPVFSWTEGMILGRVMDILIDKEGRSLKGLVLNKKNLRKENKIVFDGDILKIYRDGVVVTAENRVVDVKVRSADGQFYVDCLQNIDVPLHEGEIVTDLIFDVKNHIEGYEVSRGIWEDISYGRHYYPINPINPINEVNQ